LVCSSCGAENRPGRKFCSACGKPLAVACAACGAANEPGDRFCGECGSPLPGDGPPPAPPSQAAPTSERRLVSVLFADLVGFTPLSEERDPEEVRELLSQYFDSARRVIERYGGTVEKFIGDAVMAVWGTPVAREDDAERAARAALELVAEVSSLGAEAGVPGLRLRAGVTTGETAVTIGAEGQGMVAGDVVNTAARIQAAAPPGGVLVDEPTRRAIEASIVCEEAGEHELKGKAEPVALWRAVRVIAARRGEGRSSGLEAPFVGRDAEFRLVRDLLHATAEEGKARLVSVIGVAGIGKSRLGWEFYKYFDGLLEDYWWHRGRCLAYGEGVAFWALAEMVRMRARISEDEPPEAAITKLEACLEEHFADREERAWIGPRLRHLLGLAERTAPDREDLFSAWRRFFERLAEQGPCILLFEDLQWADAALLDFVEYLLEWSRNHPLYVVTLARPELMERRPNWGAGKRNFTSLYLEPLPDGAMEELLSGLVPGLSEELRGRIRERAEGVPLYAVETVRMLLDRGLLEQVGNEYRPTGPIDALAVPETLHALIAARLDGLEPAERRVLEDASILGKTFTTRALAAVAGLDESDLEPLLGSLVRKEILGQQTDPRSPERGQFGFLQALVQKVAYETLARRERKARHLRAAAYLESGLGPDEEEIAEVIAAHYLEAYQAAPDAEDAVLIKAKARERLAAAAERAASLAATEEARRYFEQAAELADEPVTRAGLLEDAGRLASVSGQDEDAEVLLENAIALFEDAGLTHPAARVSARLGDVLWNLGRIDEGVARMEQSFAVLSTDPPDEDLAALAAELARLQHFTGHPDLAAARIEFALEIAEALRLPEVLSQALNTKALILEGRPMERYALLKQALEIALEHDLVAAALRAFNNLAAAAAVTRGRYDEVLDFGERGLVLARRRGDRTWEWRMLMLLADAYFFVGRWDDALAAAAAVPEDGRPGSTFLSGIDPLLRLRVARGELAEAARLGAFTEGLEQSADVQERALAAGIRFALLCAQRRHREALAAAEEELHLWRSLRTIGNAALALVDTCDAAFALGDLERVAELLSEAEQLAPGARTPFLDAHLPLYRSRLAGLRGEGGERVEIGFKAAAAAFRELGTPFYAAAALLEHGEWLSGEGRSEEAEPLLAEAKDVFERLEAHPWLERVDRVIAGAEAVA
jgi:class 3 adenylate cyclase/tetratricopeptide (TPR) repeat protein